MIYYLKYNRRFTKYFSISKTVTKALGQLPKIKRLTFSFMFNTKIYKKNLILFYIVLSLVFHEINILKEKDCQNIFFLYLKISEPKIWLTLQNFVNVYLPLIQTKDNNIKTIVSSRRTRSLIFDVNYFSFPVIPELNLLYFKSDLIYKQVSFYRFQVRFYIQRSFFVKDFGEFLVRYQRLPYRFKSI